MNKIYINFGIDPAEMTYQLLDNADIKSQLNAEMTVCLKPNLVVSRPAEEGATTHPEILRGIIIYLREQGIKNIVITESSWVGDSTQKAFEVCGYNKLKEEFGVTLVDNKRDDVIYRDEQGQHLAISRTPAEADYLINLPVLKAHCQTNVTCCLKNLKGCIPDSEKRRFHADTLHQPIAALSSALRPDLHIVDNICGDLTFEEGGNPVVQDRIMLGFDPVLLDSYGAQLLGYKNKEIRHLMLAEQYGVGNFYSEQTEIIEMNTEHRPTSAPIVSGIAKRLSKSINEDKACSSCYAALIFALHKMRGYGGEKINIGQGFKNKQINGIGVGNCTSGCSKSLKGCPPKSSDIVEFLENL